MGTIAVRRAAAVMFATLLAVVACYAVFARSAHASDGPRHDTSVSNPDGSHRPVIGSGVKYVKNADGSITQVR